MKTVEIRPQFISTRTGGLLSNSGEGQERLKSGRNKRTAFTDDGFYR